MNMQNLKQNIGGQQNRKKRKIITIKTYIRS